jgi:dihydrofolate reductase
VVVTRVIADMSMSLDGFVADPGDGVDELFGWYSKGTVGGPRPGRTSRDATFRADRDAGAPADVGALVVGRHLFDITGGWGGIHPMDVPVVIVTHAPPTDWPHIEAPFTFITDGIAYAVETAKAAAAGRDVGVAGATIAQQCLDLGLLDEIHVSLVPVILGAGVAWFENLRRAPVHLDRPTVAEGDRVTHLRYPITSKR